MGAGGSIDVASEPVRKTTAVCIRRGAVGDEVLVFEHPLDEGGSMLQLPAGTVEPGEQPVDAAARELLEETGVAGTVRVLAGVLDEEWEGERRCRWVYLVDAPAGLAAEWPSTCDCGATLRCHWLPFDSARLVEAQQPWLDLARATLGTR